MIDLKEISPEEHERYERYYDDFVDGMLKNWRNHEKILLENKNFQTILLKFNLDAFTEFLKENPKILNQHLADNLFFTYGINFTNDRDYYSLLRVIPLLVELDAKYFSLFHPKYRDEQFCKVSYSANKEVMKYFSFIERLYISENYFAKTICTFIRHVKTLKALLKAIT